MLETAYWNYLESRVWSATPVELVGMLYQAAIEALEAARAHLLAGEIMPRTRQMNRATDILIELTKSVDRERGGELAQRLTELYDYILRRIHDANFHNDAAAVDESIRLLRTLLEGWQQAAQNLAAAQPQPAVYSPLASSF